MSDQFTYKLARIEEILALAPHVSFTLIGDDGEHDPEIFAAVRERHPERVAAIWIRRIHTNPQRARLAGQADLVQLLRC